MSLSSVEMLRVTVAALMQVCGEKQTELAPVLQLTQGQVSRKQTGGAPYTLNDLDLLAKHYGLKSIDLLLGPTHAVEALKPGRRVAMVGGTQQRLYVV
ncbi:helix-turn-helix domain-containing protein [Streptomyces sp. NPDC051546]|uniref:helix-turn-helix domain-containing protein n=1 Tax=Streptomyces sp. NPDC051546 TaxID=3365655 RepID=UPI00379AFA84